MLIPGFLDQFFLFYDVITTISPLYFILFNSKIVFSKIQMYLYLLKKFLSWIYSIQIYFNCLQFCYHCYYCCKFNSSVCKHITHSSKEKTSFSQFALLVKSPRGNHFWEFPMNLSKDILNSHTHTNRQFMHSCICIYIWIWRTIWGYKKGLDCQVKFNFTTIWHLIQYKAFQIVSRILVILRHR